MPRVDVEGERRAGHDSRSAPRSTSIASPNEHGKHTVKVELKNGQTAEFSIKDLGNNPQFLDFINQDEILRINTQEATLEEVFIKVTGTKLLG
jgi:hypothetical protein